MGGCGERNNDNFQFAETKRYSKRMWNKDKEPKELDVYWNELTPEQQAGAKVLGWSKCFRRPAGIFFGSAVSFVPDMLIGCIAA